MLEFCIADNIGIKVVGDHVLWMPADNNSPPKGTSDSWQQFMGYFLHPLHRSGWLWPYWCGGKGSSTGARWLETTPAVGFHGHIPAWPQASLMHCSCGLFHGIIALDTSGSEAAHQGTTTSSPLSSAEGQKFLVQAWEKMRWNGLSLIKTSPKTGWDTLICD